MQKSLYTDCHLTGVVIFFPFIWIFTYHVDDHKCLVSCDFTTVLGKWQINEELTFSNCRMVNEIGPLYFFLSLNLLIAMFGLIKVPVIIVISLLIFEKQFNEILFNLQQTLLSQVGIFSFD